MSHNKLNLDAIFKSLQDPATFSRSFMSPELEAFQAQGRVLRSQRQPPKIIYLHHSSREEKAV
jgi:hypothetical protein